MGKEALIRGHSRYSRWDSSDAKLLGESPEKRPKKTVNLFRSRFGGSCPENQVNRKPTEVELPQKARIAFAVHFRGRSVSVGGSLSLKSQNNRRPDMHLAVDFNPPAMSLHNLLAQTHPQTVSSGIFGSGLVRPVKRLE